ncbi:MAG: CBS and ACT domain-containing protein [Desulfovibrio sp.]|nr:CBS and ACT domain-containing protein [Desulfovibrio sp.]
MLIQHWMAKDVYSVDEKATLLKCRALFRNLKISRLPVVDKDKRVIGILSQNDITQFQPVHATGYEFIESMDILDKTLVKECMTPNPVCANVNETLEAAAEKMIEHRVSCLPIIDNDGKLVGIVTEWDIFKSLVSITGVNQPGIQLSFEVENKPGSLRALLDVVKAHDMRIISVLSKIRIDGIRLISIRCKGKDEKSEDALIEALKAQGTMRYWVRGTRTHLVGV